LDSLIIKAYPCEIHDAYCFTLPWKNFLYLRDLLKQLNIDLAIDKQSHPISFCDQDIHRWITIIHSAHTIQGLEWKEGTSCIGALESLVATYRR